MDLSDYLLTRIQQTEVPLAMVVSRREAFRTRVIDELNGGWKAWGDYGRLIEQVFNPEKMLIELRAKRQRVLLHGFTPAPDMWRPLPEELPEGYAGDFTGWCRLCSDHGIYYEPWPCVMLRLEAAPYIDRRDFDLAWRVDQ